MFSVLPLIAVAAVVLSIAGAVFYRKNHCVEPDEVQPEPEVPGDPNIRVQFILKQRETLYTNETEAEGQYSYGVLHSGLYNSARFVNDMLNKEGFTSEIIHVVDNNCIDREVTRFKPNVVIIEAYWVVPEKFDVLVKLHPKVKWIIRNHSKVPFLANEGIAFDWTMRYAQVPNVYVSSNTLDTNEEIAALLNNANVAIDGKAKTPFLPNFYPMEFSTEAHDARVLNDNEVHIGCFGAVRPLKNHIIQAIAAIKFAEKAGKKLFFHINGNRIENNGNNVLKNLRAIFEHSRHELVEHQWMPHDKFLLVIDQMDLAMQVSYTETFNIVAADVVSRGVPIVTSKEIDWVDPCWYADPNSSDSMVEILEKLYESQTPAPELFKPTLDNLEAYNKRAVKAWKDMLFKFAA